MGAPVTPREAAVELLLAQRLSSLHINPATFRHSKRIVFDSMQHFCRRSRMTVEELAAQEDLQDGCTLVRRLASGPLYIVLYNEDASNTRRRAFTLAHELGHIYLEHQNDGDGREAEANRFAAELLVPRILAYELMRRGGFRLNPGELCAIFPVSQAAARLRLETMPSSPRFSPRERELLRRFGGLLPVGDGPVVDLR